MNKDSKKNLIGYSYNNSMKRNARLIFIRCMEDIKRQIAKDYDRLVKALQ